MIRSHDFNDEQFEQLNREPESRWADGLRADGVDDRFRRNARVTGFGCLAAFWIAAVGGLAVWALK